MLELVREFSAASLCLRLISALLCGTIIGLEREMRDKKAGLKTHALVCLGAALCIVVSEAIVLGREGVTTDTTRIAANVVTGVGFLCAATLVVKTGGVRGLTTAAGLWTCAIIGLACGAGFPDIALFATTLVMFVFIVYNRVDNWIGGFTRGFELYAELETDDSLPDFLDELHVRDVRFTDLRVKTSEHGAGHVTVTLSASTARFGEKEKVLNALRGIDGVRYLESF